MAQQPGNVTPIRAYQADPFLTPWTDCALVLGSAWSFAPITMLMATFIVRTVLEDGALWRELPGYKEYAPGHATDWFRACGKVGRATL